MASLRDQVSLISQGTFIHVRPTMSPGPPKAAPRDCAQEECLEDDAPELRSDGNTSTSACWSCQRVGGRHHSGEGHRIVNAE